MDEKSQVDASGHYQHCTPATECKGEVSFGNKGCPGAQLYPAAE